MFACSAKQMLDARTAEMSPSGPIVRTTRPCVLKRGCRIGHAETSDQNWCGKPSRRHRAISRRLQPGTNARACDLSIVSNLFIDGCSQHARGRLSPSSRLNDLPVSTDRFQRRSIDHAERSVRVFPVDSLAPRCFGRRAVVRRCGRGTEPMDDMLRVLRRMSSARRHLMPTRMNSFPLSSSLLGIFARDP